MASVDIDLTHGITHSGHYTLTVLSVMDYTIEELTHLPLSCLCVHMSAFHCFYVSCVCVYFLYALFTLCVFSLYIFLSAVTARELDTCSVLSACLKKWLINTQLCTKTQLHVIISSLSVLKSTSSLMSPAAILLSPVCLHIPVCMLFIVV